MKRAKPYIFKRNVKVDSPVHLLSNGVGCRLSSNLWTGPIVILGQIMGSKDLLPLILDMIQLMEICRIRTKVSDIHMLCQRSVDFWLSVTGHGAQFTAKEIQCLRDTIPIESLGKERYDAAALFEYMWERFEYCRNHLGMTDLPSDSQRTWWLEIYYGR